MAKQILPTWIKSTLIMAASLVMFYLMPKPSASAYALEIVIVCVMNIALLRRPSIGRPSRDEAVVNVIRALSEGAYNVKAKRGNASDDLLRVTGVLAERLRNDRIATVESMRLILKLFNECNLSVLISDMYGEIVDANNRTFTLFRMTRSDLVGNSIDTLGIGNFRDISSADTLLTNTRYQSSVRISRADLNVAGRRMYLFVFDEVEQLLQVNERAAFDKLIRVLGHEINNSIAPIMSLSETLITAEKHVRHLGGAEDTCRRARVERGLTIIQRRALAIRTVFERYTRQGGTQVTAVAEVDVTNVVTNVAESLHYVKTTTRRHGGIYARADSTQLEQVLINLAKNGYEAMEGAGEVEILVREEQGRIVLQVMDSGPGLPISDSLFVPFFTTKPEGSGLGLSVSRDIVVGFGGSISLRRDEESHRTVAEVILYKTSSGQA